MAKTQALAKIGNSMLSTDAGETKQFRNSPSRNYQVSVAEVAESLSSFSDEDFDEDIPVAVPVSSTGFSFPCKSRAGEAYLATFPKVTSLQRISRRNNSDYDDHKQLTAGASDCSIEIGTSGEEGEERESSTLSDIKGLIQSLAEISQKSSLKSMLHSKDDVLKTWGNMKQHNNECKFRSVTSCSQEFSDDFMKNLESPSRKQSDTLRAKSISFSDTVTIFPIEERRGPARQLSMRGSDSTANGKEGDGGRSVRKLREYSEMRRSRAKSSLQRTRSNIAT